MNVLAIGNSFSCDATRYLYGIARAAKTELNVVNLSIGGCPLSKHYKNILGDEKKYTLLFNGQSTDFLVSIKEALLSRNWDYIVFQQASRFSVDYKTYQPYLNELSAYAKKCAPEAKQVIHQTWAYEQGTQLLHEVMGYADQKDMFSDVKKAYDEAAKDIKAEFIIPSGEIMQALINVGVEKVHRDGHHASLGLGRYAMALLWFIMLTGKNVKDNAFNDFDVFVSDEEIAIAKKCAAEVAAKYSDQI